MATKSLALILRETGLLPDSEGRLTYYEGSLWLAGLRRDQRGPRVETVVTALRRVE